MLWLKKTISCYILDVSESDTVETVKRRNKGSQFVFLLISIQLNNEMTLKKFCSIIAGALFP